MSPAPEDRKQIDVAIGKAVEIARDPWSQKELADQMRALGHKWSQATVWSVEKGDRPLRLSEAMDLANLLRITLSQLLDAANGEREAEWSLRSHVAEFNEHILALDDEVEAILLTATRYRAALGFAKDDLTPDRYADFIAVFNDFLARVVVELESGRSQVQRQAIVDDDE